MDLDLQTIARFSVGWELAALISSCGIVHKAWEEIYRVSEVNVDTFHLKEDDGVAYVTFPSFSIEDFNVKDSKYEEYNIQDEKIFSVCFKGDDDKPAIVHEGAFKRFLHIFKSPDFRKILVSMGGAVAVLAILWFLQKRVRNISYFCITFGSPLVGNDVLGKLIGREDWTGNFFHVVSEYDIVPRMLLVPLESIAEFLNAFRPHWGSLMGIRDVGLSHPSVPKACETVLKNVLRCTFAKENNYPAESGLRSPYRPFGTYMFCSTQGAACIEDSEAVLKMLHFTMQGKPLDQLAGTCVSDHTSYGHMLEALTKALVNTTPLRNFVPDSFEMGMALELEAMGVGAQNQHASLALRKAGEVKKEQDMNIEKLNEDLSKSQSHMAEVEWYKESCKNGSGYYDSFKVRRDVGDAEYPANLSRDRLGKILG